MDAPDDAPDDAPGDAPGDGVLDGGALGDVVGRVVVRGADGDRDVGDEHHHHGQHRVEDQERIDDAVDSCRDALDHDRFDGHGEHVHQ